MKKKKKIKKKIMKRIKKNKKKMNLKKKNKQIKILKYIYSGHISNWIWPK